jgi:hypothetical protein
MVVETRSAAKRKLKLELAKEKEVVVDVDPCESQSIAIDDPMAPEVVGTSSTCTSGSGASSFGHVAVTSMRNAALYFAYGFALLSLSDAMSKCTV